MLGSHGAERGWGLQALTGQPAAQSQAYPGRGGQGTRVQDAAATCALGKERAAGALGAGSPDSWVPSRACPRRGLSQLRPQLHAQGRSSLSPISVSPWVMCKSSAGHTAVTPQWLAGGSAGPGVPLADNQLPGPEWGEGLHIGVPRRGRERPAGLRGTSLLQPLTLSLGALCSAQAWLCWL